MTTQQVADRYYELTKESRFEELVKELYSPDIVSVEPESAPMQSIQGMEAYLAKSKQFEESIEEMHGGHCDPPIVSENHFACVMGMDVTFKEGGRMKMDEIAVFEVKDGKVVKEMFFY